MKFLRRFVFYLFSASYVVFCPLVLLYAFGDILSPAEEDFIVETGLISLASVPSGALVYLQDTFAGKKTPTIIGDLLPGQYWVRIELENYQRWEQAITVRANQAAVYEKIILAPNSWTVEVLSSRPYTNLIPILGSASFVIATSSALQDHQIYDPEKKAFTAFLEATPELEQAELISSDNKGGGGQLVLTVSQAQTQRRLLVGLPPSATAKIMDVTAALAATPQSWWDPDSNWLYQVGDGQVDRINPTAKEHERSVLTGIRGFGLADRRPYILDSDSILWRLDRELKNKQKLTDEQELRSLIGGLSGHSIHPLSKDTVLIAAPTGALFVNRPPYRLMESGFRGFAYSPESQHLLYFSSDAIGTADLWEDPLALERDANQQIATARIYSGGYDLRQVYWVYDGSHVLANDNGRVVLLETYNGAGGIAATFDGVASNTAIDYDDSSGTLFFIDAVDHHLVGIRILPREFLPGIIPREIRDIFVPTKEEE